MDDAKPKLKHSEDYTKCVTLLDFQKHRRFLEDFIKTNSALGLATSAWEKELEDTNTQIGAMESLQRDTLY